LNFYGAVPPYGPRALGRFAWVESGQGDQNKRTQTKNRSMKMKKKRIKEIDVLDIPNDRTNKFGPIILSLSNFMPA
jgi:hypothetical protein